MSDPLLDALDVELPDSWKQDEHGGEGATLVGTLLGWNQGSTQKYGEKDIAIIREDKTEVIWGLWLLSTVLCDEFATARPQIGERLAVRYLGRAEGPRGEYQRWKVAVEGRLGAAKPSYETPELIAAQADQAEEDVMMAAQIAKATTPEVYVPLDDPHPEGTEQPWPSTKTVTEVKVEELNTQVEKAFDGAVLVPGPLPVTKVQELKLNALCKKLGEPVEDWKDLSRAEADILISDLTALAG